MIGLAEDVDEVAVDRIVRWALTHPHARYPHPMRRPDRDQSAIVLIRRHRWSLDDAAEAIGQSRGTTRKILDTAPRSAR